jgi:2,3-bisphosphoglycerate-independent phosphoglycerate mutase
MLKKHPSFPGVGGPVVTVIMDGFGVTPNREGNAIYHAYTPTLDRLFANYPHSVLKAHGTAVGMPSDGDMGNSEVGHNAMGAGQIFEQGAALVNEAIASGTLFQGEVWGEILDNVKQHNSTLHFLGLFSDGNVHSHIDHLKALILRAKQEKQKRVRVHILLDGRDVPETSALDYVEPFEQFLAEIRGPDFDVQIASGGGRMNITMDRYEAAWSMVEKGWRTHVLGNARQFESATQAIIALREEASGSVIDQDLPPFVVAKGGEPVGRIEDNDSVVFYNFRGDRAIEITRAFEEENFDKFDRVHWPKVIYAGMLQYDGDLHLPKRFLVPPPAIRDTMGEYLSASGITQLAMSETQKYGHVTYFWNGNRSGKFSDKFETYIEIPSDHVPFEERPWMKSAEIIDELIRQLRTGSHRCARINLANGDMVGHTGIYQAAIIAVEAVDLALRRLLPVIDELGGVAIITADHGNADEMYELDKTGAPKRNDDGSIKAKTSHTLNPVPFIFYDNRPDDSIVLPQGTEFGLSNLAATIVNLLGFAAPEQWDRGILEFR